MKRSNGAATVSWENFGHCGRLITCYNTTKLLISPKQEKQNTFAGYSTFASKRHSLIL